MTKEISIHAPRVGSDGNQRKCNFTGTISIHAPRVGSDEQIALRSYGALKFQSTLPVWGATPIADISRAIDAISIHAPRVGSDPQWEEMRRALGGISIHAPRVGSDPADCFGFGLLDISIHAPRVGSDTYCDLRVCVG